MHELSIALNLIEIASEEARAAGAERVTRVTLNVGALSGVVPEALQFAFEVATEQTLLQGATLDINPVPVTVYCGPCQAEKVLPDLIPLRCPDCGTPTAEIRRGRELEITTLEID